MTQSHPPVPEIKALTALRGLAAMWVVVYHFRHHFVTDLVNPIVANGYLAVDLFFVLSGFILYYVYIGTVRSGSFRHADFIVKRIARLYPVHFVTLLAAVLIFVGAAQAGLKSDLQAQLSAVWANLLMLHA